MSLTRTLLAAALGLAVTVPAVVAPAAAETVVIRHGHPGWHRDMDHRHGCRVTVVRRHTPNGVVVRRMKVCH